MKIDKKMKFNKNCPCGTKTCPFWGKCQECRKAMASEGVPPVCEQ